MRMSVKPKALLRSRDRFTVLEEGVFEQQTELQEALKRSPEVIPVGDLHLGVVVVVGLSHGVGFGSLLWSAVGTAVLRCEHGARRAVRNEGRQGGYGERKPGGTTGC